MKTTDKKDVGILIGRFQSPWLHEGHKELIDKVASMHQRVIIFLGVSPLRHTLNNPLDLRSRRAMIVEEYPDIETYYIEDEPTNEGWSNRLDSEIKKHLKPTQTCILYGSRDSFLNLYTGKLPTEELEASSHTSATEVRKLVRNSFKATRDFRAGIIHATGDRFPTAFQAVDVAIIEWRGVSEQTALPPGSPALFHDREINRPVRLLLGRKPKQKLFRFIGGFSDPRSESLEMDARREAREETGLDIGDVTYLSSHLVDDWRFRNEQDKIKTVFFKAKYTHGRAEAQDDIEEVKWFSLDSIKEDDIVPEHRPLLKKLMNNLFPQEAA